MIRDHRFYIHLHRRKVAHERIGLPPLEPEEVMMVTVMEWRLAVPVIMAFRSIAEAEI